MVSVVFALLTAFQPLPLNAGAAYQVAPPATALCQPHEGAVRTFTQFAQEPTWREDSPQERMAAYQLDLTGDGQPELLMLPQYALTESHHYLPTWQRSGPHGWEPLTPSHVDNGAEIAQDYYEVKDIRDFNGDGRLDVLMESNSGASSYNTTQHLYWWDGQRLRLQHLYQFVEVLDLDGDGTYELVMRAPGDWDAATLPAHANWAYWPDVYRWLHGRYQRASHQFPAYYRQGVIPDFQAQLAELRQQLPPDPTAIAALQGALDKAQALLKSLP